MAPLLGANGASPNPLAGFEGPLRERKKEGREWKGRKKRDGRKHPLK